MPIKAYTLKDQIIVNVNYVIFERVIAAGHLLFSKRAENESTELESPVFFYRAMEEREADSWFKGRPLFISGQQG